MMKAEMVEETKKRLHGLKRNEKKSKKLRVLLTFGVIDSSLLSGDK